MKGHPKCFGNVLQRAGRYKSYFYNWLFINALSQNKDFANEVVKLMVFLILNLTRRNLLIAK